MLVAIFDIYGTLLTSNAGEQIPDDTEMRRRIKAEIQRCHNASAFLHPEVEIRDVWARVFPEKSVSEIEREILMDQQQHFAVEPMPGARELLQGLKHQGMLTGLISNAQFYTMPMFYEALGSVAELGLSPDLICESWRHLRAKPGLHLYEEMRGRLYQRGIPPEQVLYIGNDVRNDIQPARSVGFKTALFAGDSRSLRWRGTTPETCGADYIIPHLLDCMKILTSP